MTVEWKGIEDTRVDFPSCNLWVFEWPGCLMLDDA